MNRRKTARPTRHVVASLVESLEPRAYFAGVAFFPTVAYPAGSFTTAVTAADVNGDGSLDILAGNYGDGTVSVLLNNGAGLFTPGGTLAVGNGPSSIAAADINGDGKTDLIVANAGTAAFDKTTGNGSTLAILLGNGDGTFQPATFIPTPAGAQSVIAVDLTGDGKLDLVSANRGADNIAVWFGNGDGTFTPDPAGTIITGDAPSSVVAADMNLDGKLDLVVSNNASGTVTELLGNGDGTFSTRLHFMTAAAPRTVAVADVNTDGKPDILTANYATASVTVLIGLGNGFFKPASSVPQPGAAFSVAVADMNEDGKPDVVTASQNTNGVGVQLRGSFSGLQPVALFLSGGVGPTTATVADVNNDGKPDVITANFNNGVVGVLINKLQTSTTTLVSSQPTAPRGAGVQLTAVVHRPLGSTLIPTGFVQFFEGTRSIGSTAVRTDGTAAIVVASLPLGVHSLTARYVGDSLFIASQSPPITQTIVLRPAGAHVSPTLNAVNLPNTFVPGDAASARLTLQNQGSLAAVGVVDVRLLLSTDMTLSADDVPLPARFGQLSLRLAPGGAVSLNDGFTVPANLAPGTYFVIAQVTPISGLTPDDVDETPASTAASYDAVLQFGRVGTRNNVALSRPQPDGTTVVYRLAGPGTGRLGEDASGNNDVLATGTTSATTLSISASGGTATSTLRNLATTSAIGTINAGPTHLTGALQIAGTGASRITLGDVALGSIAANSLGALSVLHDFDGTATITGRLASVFIGGTLTPNSRITAAPLPPTANVGGQIIHTATDPRFHA